jgi:DNA-binding CsgD family transcriptional regulator
MREQLMKSNSRLNGSDGHVQSMCSILSVVTAFEEPVARAFKQKVEVKAHLLETVALGPTYPEVFLTEREAHCCLFLILGFTSKETAVKLFLSSRTVEHYVSCVRVKLGVKKKSGVIRALLNSDYIVNLNTLLDQDIV